jgi:hypothetical protein
MKKLLFLSLLLMHPTLHPADKQSLRQVKTLAQIALTVLIEEGSKDS